MSFSLEQRVASQKFKSAASRQVSVGLSVARLHSKNIPVEMTSMRVASSFLEGLLLDAILVEFISFSLKKIYL